MIELDGFRVDFGDFVLGPLSFRIAPGERVALVGPNGAGKSTTLRGIIGLLPVNHGGHVRIGGRDAAAAGPEIRASIGLLPERLLGFGWMTVAEHFAFLRAFYPTWDPGRAEELRRRLELPATTKLAHLSRGMQVKLALVAAEAYRPPIVLLDEPTSGIDPIMRDDLLEILRECASEDGGRTVVFSSHILEDVEAVAERVLLLRGGVLVGDVTVEELRTDGSGSPVSQQLVQRLRAS